MIVYADRQQRVDTRAFLQRIEQERDSMSLFILLSQLESGCADEWCAEEDEEIGDLPATLPETIVVKPLEGFAYYSLYPDSYIDAARRYFAESRPQHCFVIGLRSIGASLAAAVAAGLSGCRVESVTVRPRGHPFNRTVLLGPRLRERIGCSDAEFLVVDEGPGLSGSSFASVAEVLNSCGISDARIIFFPSWDADATSFKSARARERWPRHRRYVAEFAKHRHVPDQAIDLSGGLWRGYLYESESDWPPVQPQHERRKYLAGDRLYKFAGLGHFGRARLERAHRLAAYIPEPLEFSDGFLISRFAAGEPVRAVTPALLDRMADYLAHLRREFTVAEAVNYPALREMVRVNLGRELPERCALVEDEYTVAADGRMLPHEWINTSRGYLKTDALDHHDDHFFPGCQDIAWDIAGAAVEFGFPAELLAERYLSHISDATLLRRLSFYRLAYLAYRIGYCTLAAGFPGFEGLLRRYREAIDHL